jgi:hypothetical protein
MVIFHSYVNLPEGNRLLLKGQKGQLATASQHRSRDQRILTRSLFSRVVYVQLPYATMYQHVAKYSYKYSYISSWWIVIWSLSNPVAKNSQTQCSVWSLLAYFRAMITTWYMDVYGLWMFMVLLHNGNPFIFLKPTIPLIALQSNFCPCNQLDNNRLGRHIGRRRALCLLANLTTANLSYLVYIYIIYNYM